MARKRKKKRRQNSPNAKRPVKRPRKPSKRALLVSESPFAGLSTDEIADVLKNIGDRAETIFAESLLRLQASLLRLDPFAVLAMFSFYDLTSLTAQQSEWERLDLIGQHQVEIVQALCLRSPIQEFGSEFVSPGDFQSIRDTLRDLTMGFAARRYKELTANSGEIERRQIELIERIRLDTQAVRNWGEADQITRILAAIFRVLDGQFEDLLGVKATDLIQMWLNVLKVVEDRLNDHTHRLAAAMGPKQVMDMIEAYYDAFPDLEGDASDLQQFARDHRITRDKIRSLLLSHSSLRLADIFRLDLADFVQACPNTVDADQLRTHLERWSIGFGDLADEPIEFFFLNNPIWDRPLMRLGNGAYFWPVPGAFISFCFRIMERIMKPYPDLEKRYNQRRGDFLEEEVGRVFASAFPGALILRGSMWSPADASDIFENDLLVQLDTLLFVVEVKAGGVADTARRGADKTLKRVIDDLVVAPARQSQRFAEFLTANQRRHELRREEAT